MPLGAVSVEAILRSKQAIAVSTGLGVRAQLLAEAGEPVADRQALDQFAADGLLKGGEPALHGGLIDPEVLGGRDG